jgi:hypothetical protein
MSAVERGKVRSARNEQRSETSRGRAGESIVRAGLWSEKAPGSIELSGEGQRGRGVSVVTTLSIQSTS